MLQKTRKKAKDSSVELQFIVLELQEQGERARDRNVSSPFYF